MTRSNPSKLHAYDPEIDKTFHRLIRSCKSSEVVSNSSHKSSDFAFDFGVLMFDNNMVDNNKTLKEFATLDVMDQPWCIRYSELEQAQSRLIHLLPKFHGLAGENPYKHLKEFHVMCSTKRPYGILEDYIKMKAFPFSLDGVVKD
ncbi:hypothetical protein CR513_36950, partial [Mucuna pruriens]